MSASKKLRKTSLFEVHKASGARFTGFAGFELPARYTELKAEHRAVRERAGLFDVSHMGVISLEGDLALQATQLVTTNDASKLKDGKCQYTLICNESGGVIDDTVLYRINKESYFFCVNGSSKDKVFLWFREKLKDLKNLVVTDKSSELALIALQGPLSERILQKICKADLSELKYYSFTSTTLDGVEVIISRTGYTGEDGFELYLPNDSAKGVWEMIMASGKEFGILPAGLGARDTLRQEMGFPLYGQELDEETSPLEASLKKFVSFKKGDFFGKSALEKELREGVKKRLIAIELIDSGIARAGANILEDGKVIGKVTSGTFSPTLERAIALGYIDNDRASSKSPDKDKERKISVEIRGKTRRVVLVKRPFYKKPKAS
ncbi:MAG: glycine cleavage system aminomethyltransferase GcvT [Deltaproteobacteria bacterium]|nr:glycine cleavage system aminomethyltransferase GcvT [Deltaproteobacteria bacterium]